MKSASFSDIRRSLTPDKHRADSLLSRWLFRPLSYPTTWVFVQLGATANTVSYLSILVCLVASLLMGWGHWTGRVAAAVLFNVFAVLDCADGNVARVSGKKNPYGSWADALAGYIAYSCVLVSSGVAAQASAAGVLATVDVVLAGGIGAVANLLMRLVSHLFREATGDTAAEQKPSLIKIVSENVGITGFMMPAVLLGVLLDRLGWVVLAYSGFYSVACLMVVVRLMLRAARLGRQSTGRE